MSFIITYAALRNSRGIMDYVAIYMLPLVVILFNVVITSLFEFLPKITCYMLYTKIIKYINVVPKT